MLIEGGHTITLRKSATANGETFEYELIAGDPFRSHRDSSVSLTVARKFAAPRTPEEEAGVVRQLLREALGVPW